MHAQQLPPGAAMGPHPGLPGLPGLGPGGGLPVPTSASASLLGLGLNPGSAPTPGGTPAHPLSILGKQELHRSQPDDLKSNGGIIYNVMHLFLNLNFNMNIKIGPKHLCVYAYLLCTRRREIVKSELDGFVKIAVINMHENHSYKL